MTQVKVMRQPLGQGFNSVSLFESLFNDFPQKWGRDWQGLALPPMNLHETNEGYHIELIAPGRNKEDFQIELEKGVLRISFEKKEESEQKEYKTLRREFTLESFSRSFNLGEGINPEDIQARYENGILKLFLLKKPVVKESAKQISIQ